MTARVPTKDKSAWGVKHAFRSSTKISLMWRCVLTHRIKCAVTAKWKNTSCVNVLEAVSACKRGLAAERGSPDGVGYSWIDTLKEVAAQQVSDQQLETARFRFPYNTPTSKEAYSYREIFEELFPLPSAAECVPGGPSVACSSAKAIEWDEAFKKMDDPSGRAVGVHQSAYK